MAKGYRPVERDQLMLLPPDMREWLGAGHPVWLVIEVVHGHLDTSAAHRARRAGGRGAAGYDPDMMVALLAWAYGQGVTSSRRIEQLCRTDVAFRVICGGRAGPDHVTIARFRAGLGPAAADLFAGVLGLCARLGMGRLGVIALDGTKIAANASKSANRSRERLAELARELVAAHAAADAAEDELFGPGVRGDELPPEVADPRTRGERIAAALADLQAGQAAAGQADQAKAAEYLEAAAAGKPPPGPRPAGADVAAAQLRLDRLAAAQEAKIASWQQRTAAKKAATGTGLPERPPKPPAEHAKVKRAAERAEKAKQRAAERDRKNARAQASGTRPVKVRNITDPHSRLMPVRGGGFIQGYNAQVITSEDGLILATTLTQDTTDTAWFAPMLEQAQAAAALIAGCRPPGSTRSDQIGLVLADAGYLSEHNLTCDGPDRIIAVGKRRDLEKAARGQTRAGHGHAGPATTAMAERLKTPEAITAYRHRGHIAETPHAHIKHNMGIRQLSMRGKPKATAEWTFTAAVHNLLKAITTGHLTSHALATLAR